MNRPSAYRAPVLLKLTQDGDLYNAMSNQLVARLQPGEMIRFTAGGEYTIIVHRNVGKKPAKILKLSQGEKP